MSETDVTGVTGVVKLVSGKPLRCRQGHVIGLVERRADGINQLHVLRMAEMAVAENGKAAEMLPESWFSGVVVEGVIRCSLCGGQRRFVQERGD